MVPIDNKMTTRFLLFNTLRLLLYILIVRDIRCFFNTFLLIHLEISKIRLSVDYSLPITTKYSFTLKIILIKY